MPGPNREARRRRERAMARLMRSRSTYLESAAIDASCGWPTCGWLVARSAPDIKTASRLLREHYRDHHGGSEP